LPMLLPLGAWNRRAARAYGESAAKLLVHSRDIADLRRTDPVEAPVLGEQFMLTLISDPTPCPQHALCRSCWDYDMGSAQGHRTSFRLCGDTFVMVECHIYRKSSFRAANAVVEINQAPCRHRITSENPANAMINEWRKECMQHASWKYSRDREKK